jgi:transposase-like protein
MPDKNGESMQNQQHTSEFKLQVVLEYLRNPRAKRRILKEKGITEEQLEEWHREFLDRAEQIFGGHQNPTTSPPVKPESSEALSVVENQDSFSPPAEADTAPAASTWGIRLNRGWLESYHSPSSSKEYPSWVQRVDRNEWEHKPGLVIWIDASKKMERLSPLETLGLLKKLREDDCWHTEGMPITRHVARITLERAPKRRASRKKKKEEATEPAPEEKKPEWEEVEEEVLRLNPPASVELFEFLQQHEGPLKEMAEEQQKHAQEVLEKVYSLILRSAHAHDIEEIDLSKRSLPWAKQSDGAALVCDVPPNRGTVKTSEDNYWFWQACIEQPDHFKNERADFVQLEEALSWAEKELLSIQASAKAEKEPAEPPPGTTRSQIDLTPYRIDPAALEPTRITYRVAIYLERVPEHFKTMEMSFGKLMRYDEKFPSLLKVLEELKLDESVVKFEQPGGLDFGWYFLFSTATYYEEGVARAQAQKLWDASTIQRLYKEGKVTRARYGTEEVETSYGTWLGGLGGSRAPMGKTRDAGGAHGEMGDGGDDCLRTGCRSLPRKEASVAGADE